MRFYAFLDCMLDEAVSILCTIISVIEIYIQLARTTTVGIPGLYNQLRTYGARYSGRKNLLKLFIFIYLLDHSYWDKPLFLSKKTAALWPPQLRHRLERHQAACWLILPLRRLFSRRYLRQEKIAYNNCHSMVSKNGFNWPMIISFGHIRYQPLLILSLWTASSSPFRLPVVSTTP